MITAILKHLFNSTVFKSICQLYRSKNQGPFGNYDGELKLIMFKISRHLTA